MADTRLTFTWSANDCIGVMIHLQQLKNLVDISQFVSLGDMTGLTKQSRELERFSDRTSFKMYILLLDITRFPLKRLVSRFAVDQNPTANYTHSNTSSEDVEESSLSSSGYALLISIERSVDVPLMQSKYQV